MAQGLKQLVSKAFSLAEKEASVLQTLHEDALATLKRMTSDDPGLQGVLDQSFGYAVFPSVGKASLVVGGAFGKGELFRNQRLVGYTAVVQVTVGVQLGGQTFGQVIVFEDEQSFERFKQGRTTFAANASAVLVKAGAAASARFQRGVVVFVSPDGGASLEASIGGQKFYFFPAVLGRGRRAPAQHPGQQEKQTRKKPGGKRTSSRRGATARPRADKPGTLRQSGRVKSASRRRGAGRRS